MISAHFSEAELACRDGTPVPSRFFSNAIAICARAEVLRTLVGSPLIVRSGYRTRKYNRSVGGALDSWHLTASALDLHSRTWSAKRLATLYSGLVALGAVTDGGLGIYERDDGGWIHLDLGAARRWYG